MRIVFIGHFPPPFDPITLNNLSMIEESKSRGDVVKIINAGSESEKEEASKSFLSLLKQIFIGALQADTLHFLTRGYDRQSVFVLFFIAILGKLFRRRIFVTIHPEMFCFLGPLRSRHVGKPLFRLSFWLTDVVYCNGKDVAVTAAAVGCPVEKIVTRSLTLTRPEADTAVSPLTTFMMRKKVTLAVLAPPECTYLRRECQLIIASLHEQYRDEFGLILIGDDGSVIGLLEYSGDSYKIENPTEIEAAVVLTNATMIVRPLQCLGNLFMPDDAFMVELPTVLDGATVDFSQGFVFIRKGNGLLPTQFPSIAKEHAVAVNGRSATVSDIILQKKPQNALLLGVFPPPFTEETIWNENIRNELETAGVACQTISLAEAPFDNNKASSFFAFIKHLNQEMKRQDCLLYMTQGYTRPSLLLLLAVAVVGKLWRRKRVYVLFHRDLFGFFGRMRSRNAGLPLLFTSFSLVDAIFASREGCEVAQQYFNAPSKFHVVAPTYSVSGNGRAAAPPSFLVQKSAGGILCNQLIQTLQAPIGYEASNRSRFVANGHNPQTEAGRRQQIHAYQTSNWVVRPLQCNGETIGGDTACLIESPIIPAAGKTDFSGAIVVRRGTAQLDVLVNLLSVTRVREVVG